MKVRPTTSAALNTTPRAEPAPTTPTPAPAAAERFSPAGGAAPVDLEAASHGYTSPTRVECPFSAAEKKALSAKIPCPALAGMFNADLLKVDKDGTVKVPDLERALGQLGLSPRAQQALAGAGDNTDEVKGQFNLFALNGSNLDHTGSTGIRQAGVHPERFELLMTFSKDGATLTRDDLADAAEHFAKEDPGLRGRVTQLVELSAVLEVFGRHAPDGSRYLTREDARQLFVEGHIPSSWSPPLVPGKVGLGTVLGKTALGLFRQLLNDS